MTTRRLGFGASESGGSSAAAAAALSSPSLSSSAVAAIGFEAAFTEALALLGVALAPVPTGVLSIGNSAWFEKVLGKQHVRAGFRQVERYIDRGAVPCCCPVYLWRLGWTRCGLRGWLRRPSRSAAAAAPKRQSP